MSRLRRSVPSLITFATLLCGMTAIALAVEGQLGYAGALILVGYLLDGIDGETARRLGVSSEFGLQLDSLVDLVNFGAASAILAGQHLREGALGGWPVWLFAMGFVVAGAYRLARFNLGAGAGKQLESQGLTISTGGAYVALSVLADRAFGHELFPDWIFLTVLLATSVLMASRIPFPELRPLLRRRWASLAVLGSGAVAAIWLTPELVWLGLTTGYISFGLLRAGYRLVS
jgi:CDP-diacylglycerol--serine O-phosphatidyltransferase